MRCMPKRTHEKHLEKIFTLTLPVGGGVVGSDARRKKTGMLPPAFAGRAGWIFSKTRRQI